MYAHLLLEFRNVGLKETVTVMRSQLDSEIQRAEGAESKGMISGYTASIVRGHEAPYVTLP